jgi:chromate reductase
MKFFIFAGSARKRSLNLKLAEVASQIAGAFPNVEAQLLSLRDFDLPLYNGDFEEARGVPEPARELGASIAESSAVILVSPEYNGSIPGPLKNALDWVSRLDPSPFSGKPFLLLSASPGKAGGSRGLAHLRASLEGMGARVNPDSFSLPRAHRAFDPEDGLADPARIKKLTEILKGFAEKLAG